MNQNEFEAALDAAGVVFRTETRIERDGEYSYVCYDSIDDEEIGFISYRSGEIVDYNINPRGEKE